MSDTPLPHIESSGVETLDESVQSAGDRFAMPDGSNGLRAQRAPLAITGRSRTNAGIELMAYDSSPAFKSTTALSDAFTRAKSRELSNDDADGREAL